MICETRRQQRRRAPGATMMTFADARKAMWYADIDHHYSGAVSVVGNVVPAACHAVAVSQSAPP